MAKTFPVSVVCNNNQKQKPHLYAYLIMIKQAIYDNLGGKTKLLELIEEPIIGKNRYKNIIVKFVSNG